jgi:Photosynthetic reaction centre cytochrome C subunit
MRTLLLVFVATTLSFSLVAQPPAGGGGKGGGGGAKAAPKNLKILSADANSPDYYRTKMPIIAAALGVMCDFCHEMDRSVDSKPQKETARMMIKMVGEINGKFGDAKEHVTCYTCHRGSNKPATAP